MHWIRVASYWNGDPDQARHGADAFGARCRACIARRPRARSCARSRGDGPLVRTGSTQTWSTTVLRCRAPAYFSNNCPYKARRFNFYQFADFTTESLQAGPQPGGHGPQPRSHGEMHLLRAADPQGANLGSARRPAGRGGRRCRGPRSSPVTQASACPAGAIVFGNLRDPRQASVAKLQQDEPTHYGLLADIGTRPRTTYLASIRNRNPVIARFFEDNAPGRRGSSTEVTDAKIAWETPPPVQTEPLEAPGSGPASPAILGPGYSFGSVTDKISAIVQTRPTTLRWLAGPRVQLLLRDDALLWSITMLLIYGVGIWASTSRSAGASRSSTSSGGSASATPATLISAILRRCFDRNARTSIQPLRRGDDAVRGHVRRYLSAHPHGPTRNSSSTG